MRLARPLSRFPLINTSNAEETRAALTRIYARPALELLGREKTLRAVVNHCQLQHIGLSYGSYAANLRMQFPETDFASQIFPIAGKSEALINGTSVTISADCSMVISAGEALRVTNNAEYERLVLSVKTEALRSKLSAITGEYCGGPLKFNPVQDFTLPAGRALRNHFLFLVDQLNAFAVPIPNMILAEFEQTLIILFLHANRHNYSHLLKQEAPVAAPNQVRRAEEYIETNAQRAITLEELAEISGVSAFSLFAAFKKYRGYSPLAFLSQVRSRRRALQ